MFASIMLYYAPLHTKNIPVMATPPRDPQDVADLLCRAEGAEEQILGSVKGHACNVSMG